MPDPLKDLLDFAELEKLFFHFSVVTGLDAALFDAEGKEVFARRGGGSVCALAKNCAVCRGCIARGGRMSAEIGEPFITLCGCALVMCCAPVMVGDKLSGVIACGPAMLWDADETDVRDFAGKLGRLGVAAADPEKLLSSIKSCSCVNITSAAQILFIIVNSLTKEHSVFLSQRSKINRQQALIAEMAAERRAAALAYPEETEKELIALVKDGRKPQAVELLNTILTDIFRYAGGNMDTVRVKLFELVAFLSRASVDSGAPLREVNSITKTAFEICEESADFERLCFLVTQAMNGFLDIVYAYRKPSAVSIHLQKAIDVIRLHYMNDLSLVSVAREVFVSEFYLSHLFRRELDMTFSEYLCRVRIDAARRILKEDRASKITDIVGRVGFNDANYFAKTFRRVTGMKPSVYRACFA